MLDSIQELSLRFMAIRRKPVNLFALILNAYRAYVRRKNFPFVSFYEKRFSVKDEK